MRFFTYIILSVLISYSAFSKPVSEETVFSLQDKMKKNSYVELSFKQSRFKSLRKKTVTNHGKAYFKLPNKFVWSLNGSDQLWIYDGKNLLHYDQKKKAAVSYGNTASKGRELRKIISLVTRFDSLKADYNIESADLAGSKLKVFMTPKKPSADLESVNIEYNTDKNHISELRLNFTGGNYSNFSFHSLSTKKFSDKKFSLPKGVKIQTVN